MTTATPAVKTDDGGWTRALDGLGILDTPPEPEFDNIVTLATIICEAPVALVSLIDRDRQWFKARIGFEACQTSLDQSVCVHALADPSLGVFVIPDLSADPRTRENPLVVGEPYLRFYAGARLINPDGQGLGMLCVLDHQPRPGGLTHAQATGLLALANQVISLLTLRQTSAALLDARQAAADLSIGASETRLRLAVEAGQIGEWELDLSTNASIRAPQHDQIFGHPELVEEWGIDTFMAHVLPEDRVATEEAFTRAATTGVGWNFQCRIRRADDGAIRWISAYSAPQLDAEGRAIKLFGMVQDITEQKTAEERLRMLNEDLERQVVERTRETRLYGEIVQSSAAPICAFDTNYRLIAFNRAHSDEFFRIFGYQVQLGEVFPDLFPAAQAATMRALMARALTGETFTVSEAFGDLNLAKPTWEVSYSPLRDGDGRIVGAFHYARDVSVRLRTEAELATTQEALRQAQKMEAIGQLTGGVAHDFNNLLTVIRSSSDLLKRHDLPEERRTRYVAAISDTVDRAAKLTGQLLAFARRQALKPEVFAACESVRGLADMMSTLTGSRVQITTYLPEQTCYVLADLSQFDTALVNMAVNARDAMDGAGRLTIRVAPVEQMPTRRSHAALEGPFVAISINDTGSGIPPERLAQIFEPFFTTKAVGQGTGLGLSQVIGFAKQSGGDVVVESELGRGTTFTIYIPRVTGEALIVDTHEPEPLMDGHGTCVLVVEDNAAVGTFAVQTLTDLGYVPVLAANGDEALTEIAKDADRFDVVFSDVVMPGMSGIDLAQEIRRQHHDLPVLLASGYSHVLAQNGTYGFELLHKPYSVEELSRLLRKVATWKRRKRIVGK